MAKARAVKAEKIPVAKAAVITTKRPTTVEIAGKKYSPRWVLKKNVSRSRAYGYAEASDLGVSGFKPIDGMVLMYKEV